MMKNLGVYVHIPFCRKVCAYCDFYRSAGVCDGDKRAYTQAVIRELEGYQQDLKGLYSADTFYIGGGTPSVLPEGCIGDIARALTLFFGSGDEFTAEANPESFTDSKAQEYLRAGINRVSLGVQSLNPRSLRALGRIHSAQDATDALKRAVSAGMRVSADIMTGIPFQTEQDVRQFVRIMSDIGVGHLSAYMLTLADNTPLANAVARGEYDFSDDFSADMYYAFHDEACAQGYRRYEISNWAREGQESRHNIKYWTGADYLGLGAGAYSCIDGVRYCNAGDYRAYSEGNAGRSVLEKMTPRQKAAEKVVFGLRLESGVSKEIMEEAGIDTSVFTSGEGAEFFEEHNGRIKIKDRYLLVSDSIILRYIDTETL